jgi:FkbM family methyltransferase
MLKSFSRILFRLGNYFIKMSGLPTRIEKTPVQKEQEQQVALWFTNKGDKTHRLNYDLDKESIVFDLGGYEGQWASDIFSKYVCNIFIFEPFKDYAQNIEHRFKKNTKIKVFPFGLSNNNKDESLSISEDSSSIYKKGNNIVAIKLIKASEFITKNQITNINLMKINIEGGEYELLDHLIESNIVSIIDNIQVQFHNFFPNAEFRMKKIQDCLLMTHNLTYQYKFVWENWQRRS